MNIRTNGKKIIWYKLSVKLFSFSDLVCQVRKVKDGFKIRTPNASIGIWCGEC